MEFCIIRLYQPTSLQGGPNNKDKNINNEESSYLLVRRFFIVKTKIQGRVRMNSSVWFRTIMAVNYTEEKFLIAVADTIGREFGQEVHVIEILKDEFLITMDKYSTIISKEYIISLKGPIGPYRLDRYILNHFQIQGFTFEKTRSQYIRYVFNIFYENELKKKNID